MKNLREIYKIKVSLNGIKPPIWRRLLISSTTLLSELHLILQDTMGWTDSHLHQFLVEGDRYGAPDPDFDDGTIEEYAIKVSTLLKKKGDELIYEYDFGDGWEHNVTLEEVFPFSLDEQLPRCLDGDRSCPPEDVGGPWGYQEFLEAYLDEEHPSHEEMVSWAGEYFSPDGFNQDDVNKLLNKYSGRA